MRRTPATTLATTLVTVSLLGTAAGLVLAAPAPAGSAPAATTSVSGYVWANQPSTSSYLAGTGYEFNSTGGEVEIIRWETGRYRVRFAGMGSSGGVAHVRAYGPTSNLCTVASWGHGLDLNLNVRCFDSTGALADTRFVAHFTNRTVARGRLAYLWADDPTAAGPYQPFHRYAYDSTGVASRIERTGTGSYIVYLNALSELYSQQQHDDGHLQVTAYNLAAVHCGMRVIGDENPTPLGVSCHDPDGNPVDSRFTVSYSHAVSHLGTTGARGNAYLRNHWADPTYVAGWRSSSGLEPTVGHPATGTYWVRFPGLGASHGHATINTQEVTGHYCTITSWHRHPVAPDEVVNVRCYHGVTHTPVDYDFGVSFQA